MNLTAREPAVLSRRLAMVKALLKQVIPSAT